MDNDHKWTRGVDVMDCGWRLQEIANLRCTGIDFLFYLLYHRAHIILVFYQATLSVLSSSGKSHSAHVHTALSHTHTHYFLPSGKMSISVASVRSLLQIVFHWGVSHLLVWRRLRTAAETIDITPFQTDLRILHIHPYPDITNWFSLSRRPIGRVKSVLEHDIPSTCCHWPTTHILWTSGQLDPVNRVADGTG